MNPISQASDATAILKDWLGEGMVPVPQEIAERRAEACVHGDSGVRCRFNKAPSWWERMLKDPIAKVIRHQIEVKNQMQVRTSKDDDLWMCEACGCATILKVHTPIKHILAHTAPDTMKKFPSHCFIKQEAH